MISRGQTESSPPLIISLMNGTTKLEEASTTLARPTIHVVRNPLAVLMNCWATSLRNVSLEARRTEFMDESVAGWLDPKAPCSAELTKCRSDVESMIAAAMSDSSDQIHIRIEDFAAFPGATLRRICDFFETNCPIELIRCFVNAGKPERRKSRFSRAPHQNSEAVVPLAASPQLAAPTQPQDNLDLFSWVDHVPSVLAQTLVARHEPFFANYYPEVYGLFSSNESSRLAA
jgi:hypothetical protein